MPPAIQDSEDEDEILLEEDPSQRSTFSQIANHAESVLKDFPDVIPQFDGAADKPSRSTSSSEDLRRQVADAEHGLLATNSDQPSKHATGMPSSTSPALQRNKRRSTTVVGSDPGISPAKSLKRVKTYAQKRSILDEHNEEPRSPIGLPGGTIGNYFANHEPNVMFRDTGTTNAFNDSTQEELVEQALGGNNLQNTNDISLPKASNSDKSSSFLWTASAEPTQPEKSPNGAKDQNVQEEDEITVQKVPNLVRRPTIEPLSPVAKRPAFFHKPVNDQPKEESGVLAAKARSPPKSSPVVIIDRRDAVPELRDGTAVSTQTSKRGRKRKSQEAVEEQASDDKLNSDDRVLKELGLPKDQYKPRLSKRRATQVEEPLDNSLPVEKAIRKRRKTENAAAEPPSATRSRSRTRSRDGLYECPLGCSLRMTEEEVFLHLDQCPTKLKASQPKQAAVQSEGDTNDDFGRQKKDEERTKPTAKPISIEQSPKQPPRASSVDASPSSKTLGHSSSEKKADLGLMLPPTMPASASKRARRSKTTIFEDHVEFGGSQKSPNLSQQQASRKAALKEVKNGSTQKSRRKIVQDDDDEEEEEDELAKEEVEVKEAAQKKGRGRAAKASIQKPVKPTQRILRDSDAEDDEDDIELEQPTKSKARGRSKIVLGDSDAEDDDDLEADEPPVKRGCGRPPKAKSNEKVLQDSDAEHDELEEAPMAKKARGRPAKAKSTEKVLEDSDAEEEMLAEEEEDDTEPEELPKKKRPGRPSKARAGDGGEVDKATAMENKKVDIPSSHLSAVNKGDSSPTKVALSRKDSNQQPKAKEMLSPRSTPPAKPEAKPAPATHSPIKSITKGNGTGSFPIYRVGLSKTKKIPSLLKIVGKPRPDTRR